MRYLEALASAALILFAVSCGEKEGISTLSLSLESPEVGSDAGQVFVRIASNTSWTVSTDASWATISPAEGSGDKNSIILKYEANKADEARTLEVSATAGGKLTKTATLTQKGKAIVTEDAGRYSAAPYKWLELPATSSSDKYDFIYHTFQRSGRSERNFSYYWDFDNMVARWVAYPLNKSLIGTGSRSEKWGLEPLLDTAEQPVIYSAYREGNAGWYARGHQCPSADRLSYEANVQTFYGTNMTPQDNDFNGEIWASLEGKVRGWASSSDTLYVVTGCITDGAKYYVYDNYGKKVTVPTGYFKAVLRYSTTSGLGYKGYMGLGVYLEHKATSKKTVAKTDAMSIDALESKLGIDLFVNLPEAVGKDVADKIEAEDPAKVSWWW